MSRARLLRSLTLLVALFPPGPVAALIGAAPDSRFADRVAMVLMRGSGEAGFCSALVLDSRTLLTAAHCLKTTRDMAVFYRDAAGGAVIIPVAATLAHPLYRADAIRARVESIDAALIRTARPLDARFAAAAISSEGALSAGEPVILTGFGVTRAGDWKSGGQLRSVALAVREPLSSVLIWASDAQGGEAGACSGDSGAPVWSSGGEAIAIAAWAQAQRGRGCGGLTQGPLLAPLRGWITQARGKLERQAP
jgi:Trypsin